MNKENRKKSYGPTIRENIREKEVKKKHANKFVVQINSMSDNFFEQAKEACPTQDVSCVRLRLEEADQKALHIVAEYKIGTSGEYVTLGHETIKLNRGYSIDSWDRHIVKPTFRVTYCPLIGKVVYFDATVELPFLEYPF